MFFHDSFIFKGENLTDAALLFDEHIVMRLSIHANLACSQATTLSIALDAAKDTVEKLPQENAGVETMNSTILVLDSRLRSTNDASNVREFSLR